MNANNNIKAPAPPKSCPAILLTAVNARYSHSSYAARTLKANLRELESESSILEADLSITPLQLASRIIELNPKIAVFSIYLWNVRLIETTARILRTTAPHMKMIAGGPELTTDYTNADLFEQCIIGEGETALLESCREWLNNSQTVLPGIVKATPVAVDTLQLPFAYYTDEDIANRVIYIEASRGCPYHCSYCTSANTGLRLIPLERLLPELDYLWTRGLRQFKFLDRSFTASLAHSNAVMNFFLERSEPEMRLHFEINTDHLHSETAAMLALFPENALHLECGIQTLNPDVAVKVGRSNNTARTLDNLKFLTSRTGAIVHADLIFGLPGEDESSFAAGFNQLVTTCHPPELQINLLKGLPGTALAENASFYRLKFNTEPPYELLESDCMDFKTLMKIQRFARCRELVHNRGRFADEVAALNRRSSNLYDTWIRLAEFIYDKEGRMYKIDTARLGRYLNDFMKNP